MYQIRQLEHILAKDSRKEEEKRIGNMLNKMFEEHLKDNYLLTSTKDSHKKEMQKMSKFKEE